jgi:hypothetical protein
MNRTGWVLPLLLVSGACTVTPIPPRPPSVWGYCEGHAANIRRIFGKQPPTLERHEDRGYHALGWTVRDPDGVTRVYTYQLQEVQVHRTTGCDVRQQRAEYR